MNEPQATPARRQFMKTATGAGLAALSGLAAAQKIDFKPNARYPDMAVEVLDPSFLKYRLYSSSVEQLASGMRWAEGPVYFPAGRYLLLSDIPNNRIMKYDETNGAFSVFREQANYANGNTRDRQGRLLTCEHSLTRRVTRISGNGDKRTADVDYELHFRQARTREAGQQTMKVRCLFAADGGGWQMTSVVRR